MTRRTVSIPMESEVTITMDPTAPAYAPGTPTARPGGLVARLRERTRDLHREAERSGILRELLHGRASRAGYALLLRNLHPVYTVMEMSIMLHAGDPGVRRIALHDLRRRDALASDLRRLSGEGWETTLPLLPAAGMYVMQVATRAPRLPGTLIAHAYVRYLGDLSGGQVLKRLLMKTPGLEPEALSFYEFGDDVDIEQRTASYLAAIEAAGQDVASRIDEIVEEAAEAFRRNIALSEAVFEAVQAAG
jgi:heme oxygenase